MKNLIVVVCALLAFGCASTKPDPNYVAQIEAYAVAQRAQAEVLKAQAEAERARFDAIAEIAKNGDTQSKVVAMFALYAGGSKAAAPTQQQPVPAQPETDDQKAYKWASLIGGPLVNIATGYFGYRLGVTQSDNAAAASIANTNAFASTATAGFGSNATIAGAGFGAAAAGLTAATNIAGLIQAPAPNVTLSGAGVIGSGSYVNTRTCTGGAGAPGGAGGPGGGAGAAGGAGGNAQC